MWPFRRPVPPPLGKLGEDFAARHLKKLGMKILARNFRCPAGEADIIALDRSTRSSTGAETIAFVEVKTRSSNEYTEPFSAVNADKQRRLRKVARYYLRGRDAGQYNSRFDVVSIVVRDAERPEIRYIPQAF